MAHAARSATEMDNYSTIQFLKNIAEGKLQYLVGWKIE